MLSLLFEVVQIWLRKGRSAAPGGAASQTRPTRDSNRERSASCYARLLRFSPAATLNFARRRAAATNARRAAPSVREE